MLDSAIDRRTFTKIAVGTAGAVALGACRTASGEEADVSETISTIQRKIGLVLEQRIEFIPPDPAAIEKTVKAAQEVLVACQERFGYSLLGAFVADMETGSIVNLLGFEDFVAYHKWYRDSEFDEQWLTYKNVLDFAAPKYHSDLWEVSADSKFAQGWYDAALASQQTPAGQYTLEEVTAAPGRHLDYVSYVETADEAPVVSALSVTGRRGHVLSVYPGAIGTYGYVEPTESQLAEGKSLEGIVTGRARRVVYPLPYSPLQ